MIPLSDGMPPRRFPIVTTAIIVVSAPRLGLNAFSDRREPVS
jgi:hypothetical protein